MNQNLKRSSDSKRRTPSPLRFRGCRLGISLDVVGWTNLASGIMPPHFPLSISLRPHLMVVYVPATQLKAVGARHAPDVVGEAHG
jgi:hypothetical protein